MVKRWRARSGGDDGSALIVALVVITVVGLAASSMLGLADVGLRAQSRALRPARAQLFAADGAVDAAIRRIVNDEGIAKYGSSDCGLTLPGDAAVPDVQVVCEPQPGSRTDTTVPPSEASFPSQAILTLGRRANWPGNGDRTWPYNWNLTSGPPSSDPSYGVEPGILFRPAMLGSASPISIAGDLFSNSTITAEGSAVTDLAGSIAARGACSDAVTTPAGAKTCSIGYGNDGLGADPLYPHRGQSEAFPALRAVPTECTGATLQIFEPGFYNDAAALSNLFKSASCDDKDFWFRPGLYYFDFRNGTNPPDCNISGSPANQVHQWCIDSASHTSSTRPHIMGGTPVATWSPAGTHASATLENPLDAGVAESPSGAWSSLPGGVKVIDGSSAQTSWSSTSVTGLAAANTESCGRSCTDFSNLSRARAIDGRSARRSVGGSGGSVHAITKDYPTSIPTTAVVAGVTATVRQRFTGDFRGIQDSTIEIINGQGISCGTVSVGKPTRSWTTITTGALFSTCLDTAAEVNGLKVHYRATRSSRQRRSTTFELDGVEISVVYTPGARTVTLAQLQGSPQVVSSSALSIDTVELDVVAAASGGDGTFSIYPGGGGGACGTWSLPVSTITGLAGCLNTPGKVNGAYVAFTVTPTAAMGSGSLDGVRLRADYTESPTRFDFPGMCDPNEPGVQFIFGGDSHLYLPNGTFELCAGPNPSGTLTNQRIAMYGLPPVDPLKPSSATVSDGWSNASNAYSIGDSPTVLDATTSFPAVSLGNVENMSPPRPLTLSGFSGGVSIPAGASVEHVYAMVAHGQSSTGLTAPRLRVWNGEGALCAETPGEGYELNLHNELLTAFGRRYEAVDLTGCFSDADPIVAANRLNGPGLTVELDAKPTTGSFLGIPGTYWQIGSTSRVDGVQLVVELQATSATAATFIPQNGCVSGLSSYPNYWDGYADPDCALFKWDGIGIATSSPRGQVAIHGTVYAPGGALDIDDEGAPCQTGWLCAPGSYVGVDYPIVDRGILARHVRFKAFQVKGDYTGAVFSCGECGTTVTRPADVVLRAQVAGRTIVEARVQIPNQLTVPGGSPVIEEWVVDP